MNYRLIVIIKMYNNFNKRDRKRNSKRKKIRSVLADVGVADACTIL